MGHYTSGSVVGAFGSGYNCQPESILFDATGNVYVGEADCNRRILKFDPAGNPIGAFSVAREDRGADWVELDIDQCTAFYTSEGSNVKRFNVCTNSQLPNFNVQPLPGPAAFGLRLLYTKDGLKDGLLVADSNAVVRLDASGRLLSSFSVSGENCLFSLNLDPDGKSFWTADYCTSNVYKFDLATGAQLLKFNTGTPSGTVFGIATAGKILSVPLVKQGGAVPWGSTEYDDENSQVLDCGTTIGQCGCALTSVAMVLGFHGVTKDPDGNPTTPTTVNTYFKRGTQCGIGGCISLGYSYGSVRWTAVGQYSQAANARFGTPKIIWNGNGDAHDFVTIAEDIKNDRPVILKEPNHFVVATGIVNGKFTLNDPGYLRTRLDDLAYGNKSQGLRRFAKTSSDFSTFEVAALAPAQLLITDPAGNRTGFDPTTSSVIQSIPNSSYFFDPALIDDTGASPAPPEGAGVHVAIISTPIAGIYTIQIIAPPDELYSFGLYGSDRDGNLTLNLFESTPAQGAAPSYTLTYNQTPGAATIAFQVLVDIKPGDVSNVINLKSKGVIPVAILSTPTFDATTIDPLSVRFGPGSATEVHGKGHIEDANGDGHPDLVLHFSTQQSGLTAGNTQACLVGQTINGLTIQGCDRISASP